MVLAGFILLCKYTSGWGTQGTCLDKAGPCRRPQIKVGKLGMHTIRKECTDMKEELNKVYEYVGNCALGCLEPPLHTQAAPARKAAPTSAWVCARKVASKHPVCSCHCTAAWLVRAPPGFELEALK